MGELLIPQQRSDYYLFGSNYTAGLIGPCRSAPRRDRSLVLGFYLRTPNEDYVFLSFFFLYLEVSPPPLSEPLSLGTSARVSGNNGPVLFKRTY